MRFRTFDRATDYTAVSDFLVTLYEPENRDGNWFQPIWEYAYTHPGFDEESVDRIGIWEDDGRIVAVVSYELRRGEAFFNCHRNYRWLEAEMLKHAEEYLTAELPDGDLRLDVFIHDSDRAFTQYVSAKDYVRVPAAWRPMARWFIPDPFPSITLPEGFRLQSLAEDNDLRKMDRVLYRGFDHPGEPPEEGVIDRQRMQSGPNYRQDLAVVVVAPNGEFASFCGMWYDPVNRLAYVEPVATDPDYRRRGLGSAAVREGVRRCNLLGATVAYVGSTQPIYNAVGFRELHALHCWRKEWKRTPP
ncbi:MAG: GNAT family N-acetyltransferase [Capsulimonadales bacterium]|nr:GNAT family N-acetyltransferase [Capsulimonadales bacterium]